MDLAAMIKYITTDELNPDYHLDYAEDSPVRNNLNRLSNVVVQQLVVDMTQRNPSKRRTIKEYLQMLQSPGILQQLGVSLIAGAPVKDDKPLLPAYFGTVLYPMFLRMQWVNPGTGGAKASGQPSPSLNVSPDQRICIVCEVRYHYCIYASLSCFIVVL